MKLFFTCWLVLPYFSGAAFVYEHYVRPLLVNYPLVNIPHAPQNKNISSKPDDLLSVAERYIEVNGSEAFEKLISKVCQSTVRPSVSIWICTEICLLVLLVILFAVGGLLTM